jgi:beta-glucanase (GH16 family)
MNNVGYIFKFLPFLLLLQGCFKEGDIAELPDYNAPQVSFIAQTLSIPEGNKDTTIQLGIQLKGENRTQVMVKYQVNGLTATPGSDYEAITEGKIFMKPGELAVSIPIKIFGDAVKETEEKIDIVLIQALNATLSEPTRMTITLVNDDFSLVDKINIPKTGYISPDAYAGFTKVWEEGFQGTNLNSEVWNYELGDGCPGNCNWGNNELQFYQEKNAQLSDGYLIIEGKKETVGGKNYTSSRLTTQRKKSFKYGRIDIRAAVPEGKGYWPALWMLGDNIPQVSWPACGEIDIMEASGDKINRVVGTAHFGATVAQHRFRTGATFSTGEYDFNTSFNVFSIIWEENKIQWLVNNVPYHQLTPSDLNGQPYPFNQSFFFIINLAIGGNFPGSPDARTVFPRWFVVDYIKVFQKG